MQSMESWFGLAVAAAISLGCMGEVVDSPFDDGEYPNVEATGAIAGAIFEDLDRDGALGAGDAPWADKWIQLYDEQGQYITAVSSATDGTWGFSDLPVGRYSVRFSRFDWDQIKYDYLLTTLDSLRPIVTVDVVDGATARVDLGWHLIGWSSSLDAPMSEVVAADGLRVKSYTDAVTAEQVLEALNTGTLRGAEAPKTEILFGYHDTSFCWISNSGSPGTYSGYSADCFITFRSWLDYGDKTLFHEYGHAWSHYHDKIVMQDGDFTSYLEVRGLLGDDRLESNHAWDRGEMIAEDYRQLFGSPSATRSTQENREIPVASEVPGLKEFLSGEFMGVGGTPSEPTNEAPTADFSFSCSDLVCSFDAQASSDTDGSIVSYQWQFSDGSTLTGATVEHTFAASGDYQVELKVTDDGGASGTLSKYVLVSSNDGGGSTGGDGTSGPHISNTTSSSLSMGSTWKAWVTVSVSDAGAPASGVLVEATWTGEGRHGSSGSVSCTTDANGQCLVSATQAKKVSSVDFWFSAPSATVVTVAKP